MLPEGPSPQAEDTPPPAENLASPDLVVGEPIAATAAKRPRVWPVFVVFIAAIVVGQIGASVVLVAVAVLLYGVQALAKNPMGVLNDTMDAGPGMLAAILVSQVATGGVPLVAALLSPVGWRSRLRWLPARISYGAVAVSVIGALAFSNAFSSLSGLGLLPDSPVLEYLSEWLKSLGSGSRVVALLLIGVLPGIAEELLFRGYIQTRLSERWGSRWAVIVAAALFGIMHIDPVHAAFAFLIGLYLGYLTERSGSIRPAMLCHAINNTTGVLLAFLGWEIEGQAVNLAWLAGSIVLLVAAVCWLNRPLPADRPIADSGTALTETPPAA